MGHYVAKMLYGSQNYLLNTPESDEDFKWIEVPDWEELFYRKTLNRKLNEHDSVWDVRDFCKNLMKANPNALEILFSSSQEYFDKDFEELLKFVRARVGALIRVHWDEFSSAMLGIAWNAIKRNGQTPKTVSRLVYFNLLWLSLVGDNDVHGVGTNGEMTEETWRNPNWTWPRKIRQRKQLTEDDEFTVAWIGHDWQPANWHIDPQEGDEQKCQEVEEAFKVYFANYLTNH